MSDQIRTSSGRPVARDERGNRVFGDCAAHTALLLLLFCRHASEADPGEIASPWRDVPDVRQGRKTRDAYVEEICAAIDLVPADVLELVVQDLVAGNRTVKPRKTELERMCGAAMRVRADLEGL